MADGARGGMEAGEARRHALFVNPHAVNQRRNLYNLPPARTEPRASDDLTPEEAEAIIDAAEAAEAEAIVAAAEAAEAEAVVARAEEAERAEQTSRAVESAFRDLPVRSGGPSAVGFADVGDTASIPATAPETAPAAGRAEVAAADEVAAAEDDVTTVQLAETGYADDSLALNSPPPLRIGRAPQVKRVMEWLGQEANRNSERSSFPEFACDAETGDSGCVAGGLENPGDPEPIRRPTGWVQIVESGEWEAYASCNIKVASETSVGPVFDRLLGVFKTEHEALMTLEACAPPFQWVMQGADADVRCAMCRTELHSSFSSLTGGARKAGVSTCINCARPICGKPACTAVWPRSMLPPLYVEPNTPLRVRVCKTCAVTAEKFRAALLMGSRENAMAAYDVGCVNLRTPYSFYDSEFPVHCAAAGGNIELLEWLVDDRCCPLFNNGGVPQRPLTAKPREPIKDGRGLTVFGAAAVHKRVDVMRHLLKNHGAGVDEVKHMPTLRSALDACLFAGRPHTEPVAAMVELEEERKEEMGGDGDSVAQDASLEEERGDDDGLCIVCFDNPIDCTLAPCGHFCVCVSCSSQLQKCPICRKVVEEKIHTKMA